MPTSWSGCGSTAAAAKVEAIHAETGKTFPEIARGRAADAVVDDKSEPIDDDSGVEEGV